MSPKNTNKNIGYVAAYLTDKSKQDLYNWSKKYIPEEELFFTEINGKVEGGNVANKAHITLFFGFDNDALDKKELNNQIEIIELKKINLRGIKFFTTPHPSFKILVIEVLDENKELLSIHDSFKKFPHFKEDFKFTPHITIAFVKADNSLDSLGLKELSDLEVSHIEYRVKGQTPKI